jgi:hypothetical protein
LHIAKAFGQGINQYVEKLPWGLALLDPDKTLGSKARGIKRANCPAFWIPLGFSFGSVKKAKVQFNKGKVVLLS